jgi:hypothetical protein
MKNLPLVILSWLCILSYWGYRFLESNWEKIIALMSIPVTNPVKVTGDWTVWPYTIARGWDALVFAGVALLIIGLREWLEETHDDAGKPVPMPPNILGGPFTGIVLGFLWGIIQNPKEPIGMILVIAGLFGLALLIAAPITHGRYSPWSGLAYIPGLGLGYGIVHGLIAGLVVMGLMLAIAGVFLSPVVASIVIVMHRARRRPAATPPTTT